MKCNEDSICTLFRIAYVFPFHVVPHITSLLFNSLNYQTMASITKGTMVSITKKQETH